ncbi:MAG: xanthine dehydrogenase family protein molybdopterin-binding subunit [Gammaproteobacteria bacterium]
MSGGTGKSVSRLDGPEKVTGRARYTGDMHLADALHAGIVPATRPNARITLDLADALASVGVVAIFTHRNMPKLARFEFVFECGTVLPLQDDRIVYEGQPAALVVADTLECVTEAARRVKVSYRDEPFEADFLESLDRAEATQLFVGEPPDESTGDALAAWAEAEVRTEETYFTADRHHNAMEPAATLASWHDGQLLVHDATQGVVNTRNVLAQAMQLDPACVRVTNEFLGGGFGGKNWGWPHQLLAAVAARELGRPVKLVLTRAQSYTAHGYQAASRQTVALGARADGTLTSLRHDSIVTGSFAGNYVEGPGLETASLYACPAIQITHRVVRLHRGNPVFMRSPLGGIGLVAVEIAMDELAYKLGMDPLELRLKNYAEADSRDGRPFSSKKLRECYEIGARRFGWPQRTMGPRTMREGNDLIGHGMATAILTAYRFPANARVSMDSSGQVLIETSTQEIGQGSRTVFVQIAADVLGVPIERVTLALGDTSLPAAPFSTASTTTMGVGSAVHDGALKLKQKLTQAGGNAADGYVNALSKLGAKRLSADGVWSPGEEQPSVSICSFGAIFVEVRVDQDIPIPRVSRVVAVYSAGKIINPKTARSQMTGGIIWGIGQALLERSEMDPRLGRFLSKNLAGYLVPVNADVPEIDTSFVDEFDAHASPIGARGIGELGAVGIGAAIANAVFHATGVRVREVPIRPEHLMAT